MPRVDACAGLVYALRLRQFKSGASRQCNQGDCLSSTLSIYCVDKLAQNLSAAALVRGRKRRISISMPVTGSAVRTSLSAVMSSLVMLYGNHASPRPSRAILCKVAARREVTTGRAYYLIDAVGKRGKFGSTSWKMNRIS